MSYNLEFLNRFSIMLDDDQVSNLMKSKIIIFGVGGVGSALAHFLVRSGVCNLDIVDFDSIDVTNINRQLVAYQNNIGKKKIDELEAQLKNINPNVKLKKFDLKLSQETINQFDFKKFDAVIDCIDDLTAKKLLIIKCKEAKTYLLSAMGAGNRFKDVPNFEIVDISKTSYDPIAKILRKFCQENRINKLEVCYTKQKAIKTTCKTIASVVYYPVSMACAMCSHIINRILEGKWRS